MLKNKTINIVIFGIGNVGSKLIQQIQAAKARLAEQKQLHINIPVIANSKLAFFDKSGISNAWENDFTLCSVPYKIDEIIQFIKTNNYENCIAIDVTASKELVNDYIKLIEAGFHIISANKVANTLSLEFYAALRATLKKHQKLFLYETNVGAGLPIIETVKNLYDSGEAVKKIRGVFSGSLSYIFNEFSECNKSFSEVLEEATRLGLTEPDAREDLSGKDVARKLLILARELGINKELADVSVQSLVPKNLNGKTTHHQFKTRVNELDKPFAKQKATLPNQAVLRYVGELDVINKTLQVKLITENKTSAIGQLKGADSVFEIYTESYKDCPLVIQGAGAGKDVTARGVLTDIIKLSNTLN